MIERSCEICGQKFMANPSIIKRGGAKFCSRGCSALSQRRRLNRLCETCGRDFEIRPSDLYDGSGKFCSHECYWEAKKQHIVRQCQCCGKVYEAPSNRDNQKFCSRECYIKSKTERAYYTLVCQHCSKEYRVYTKKYTLTHGGRTRAYCSKQCVDKARVGKYTEDNSPNWRGGLTSLQDLIRKSTDYIQMRNRCFERDDYKSVISGRNGRIEHHHITAMSVLIQNYSLTKANWRDYKTILFDLNNAVTLTEEEHSEFHSRYGMVTSPENFEEYKLEYQ